MPTLEENFAKLQSRIENACNLASISTNNVQLIAVSKRHTADKIKALHALGQRHFAENYLQEALEKQAVLSDMDINWHFIGHIQSNKTKALAEHFGWVHSVDRIQIATRLSAQRPSNLPDLNICLQVNIDNEHSKSGFAPEQIPLAFTEINSLPGLSLRGLMAIPSAAADPEQQRDSMLRMQHLFNSLQGPAHFDTLSMGMSRDLEIAVQAGATMLRVGEALFGPRPN
ncbi:MAG: YggS family pyridoxal phosphate-dependent enzyme [Pseudomonadales bacterium]